VPHLFKLCTTFPLVHAASFIFGILLGLYYIKGDREGSSVAMSGFMTTASVALMALLFLTTDMVEGRWLLWAHDGMFLPVIGLFLYSVALGKDPLGRGRSASDNISSIAMTVYLLQGFFLNVSGHILESETPSTFWAAFWVMLLAASFFLHKVYSFLYRQHVLPWLAAEESLYRPQADTHSRSEYPIQGWFWADNICAKVRSNSACIKLRLSSV
jgi:peptidoglycan/LPS O-acetylase OafA/YrhL